MIVLIALIIIGGLISNFISWRLGFNKGVNDLVNRTPSDCYVMPLTLKREYVDSLAVSGKYNDLESMIIDSLALLYMSVYAVNEGREVVALDAKTHEYINMTLPNLEKIRLSVANPIEYLNKCYKLGEGDS